MQATVAGSSTELNACDAIMTNNGRALKIGTTKPNNEISKTIMRYRGSVISSSELV